jgi:hypothetical protein
LPRRFIRHAYPFVRGLVGPGSPDSTRRGARGGPKTCGLAGQYLPAHM